MKNDYSTANTVVSDRLLLGQQRLLIAMRKVDLAAGCFFSLQILIPMKCWSNYSPVAMDIQSNLFAPTFNITKLAIMTI